MKGAAPSKFRALRVGFLLFILLVVGAIAFLRTQFAWEHACELARGRLPGLIGADIHIGRCEIDPLSATAALYEVGLYSRRSQNLLFFADSIQVKVSAFRPLWGATDLQFLKIQHPVVRIDLDRPAASGPPGPKSQSCPLNGLRRLKILNLEITDADAEVQLDALRAVRLKDLNIHWQEEAGLAQFRVAAGAGRVTLQPEGEFALDQPRIQGRYSSWNRGLEVEGEVGVEDNRLKVAGTIEDLCDPRFQLRTDLAVSLTALSRAIGVKGRMEGTVNARATITGSLAQPVVRAEIKGKRVLMNQFTAGDFAGTVSYAHREIKTQDLTVAFGPGSATINATVKLAKEFPAQFKVDLRGAQFARIMEDVGVHGPWVDFAASGRVNLSGSFLPKVRLIGDGDIQLSKFLVATRPFDAPSNQGLNVVGFSQGRVVLGVRILHDRVDMHHFKAEVGPTHLSGNVSLFYDSHIVADAFADPLDLTDLSPVAELKFRGRGPVRAEIVGPFADVKVRSTLDLRDFGFWKLQLGNLQTQLNVDGDVMSFPTMSAQLNRTQFRGSGALKFGGGLRLSWNTTIAKGRTEDVLTSVSDLSSIFAWASHHIRGDAVGAVHIDSRVRDLDGGINLELLNTELDGRRLGRGKISLRLVDGESVVLDPSTLEGPVGRLTGQGTLSFDGPASFRFRGDGLSLAELVGPERAAKLEVGGVIALAAEVQGDSNGPAVSAYLTSPQLTLAGKRLGEMHLEGRLEGREMQWFGRLFKDAQVSATVGLDEGLPYSAKLTLSLPEIRSLLPEAAASRGLSGTVSGTIDVAGDLDDWESTEAKVKLDKMRLSRGDFAGENRTPIVLAYADGHLEISPFVFAGSNTELSLVGGIGPKTLDLKLSGNLDARLLEPLIPALEHTAGRIDLTAAASGALKDPTLVGTAEIRDGRLEVRDQPITARGISGRIDFSEARVLLQEFQGVLNEGRAALRGNVRLEHFKPKNIELLLQLDEVRFRLAEDLPLITTGELSLFGKPGALVLAGDVDILKFRYERPLVLEKLITEIRKGKASPAPAAVDKSLEWLSLDVGIHAKGDVRVENNLARAQLTGNLRLSGTNVHPGLLGSIQTAEGSQAFYRGNQFAIRQGLIEFRDRNRVDAVFDLHADTQVREYLIRLHAFGRTSSPQVVLTSEPQLSEADILSLLTLGIISRDKSNAAGAGAGLAAEALFNASGLDQQVQRFLPKNPLLRDLSFRVATVYNDASGVAEPNAQLESKFLTEQLKLRLTQPVSGRGTKAQAEYRFTDRLSAQAQWDNEQIDYSFGNFGLNLKLHWEVE